MRTVTFPGLLLTASTTYVRYSILVILAVTLFLLIGEAARGQDYYDYVPYRGGVNRDLYDRLEREQRAYEEDMYRNRGGRPEGWHMDYLHLQTCAKYNRGCAQEFYGRDWP